MRDGYSIRLTLCTLLRTVHSVLVLIGSFLRLAMHFFQAGVAVDGRRREIPGAVQGEQVAALMEDKRLQGFSTLELAKDSVEQGSYRLRALRGRGSLACEFDGKTRDAEQVPHVLIVAALVKCQQGRVFQANMLKADMSVAAEINCHVGAQIDCHIGSRRGTRRPGCGGESAMRFGLVGG